MSTPTRPTSFAAAKAFSDFIGLHVRFQFVMLAMLFVLSPIMVQFNIALRDNAPFQTNAGWVDYSAIALLLFYGLVLLGFMVRVGTQYIWLTLAGRSLVSKGLAVVTCAVFLCLELTVNGAVLYHGFAKNIDGFGVELSEIEEFNRRLWDRACLRGTQGCP